MSATVSTDDVYQVTGTFMGVPAGRDLSGRKAAVLGIPYDMGTHPTRIGSRQGPDAIRAQSGLIRPFVPDIDFNPLERLGLVDCGNVRLVASRIEDAHVRIERAMAPLVETGVTPVTMGGDGTVSLPQLRALHAAHPRIALLHLDAHTDSFPGEGIERYNTSTTFTRAREEGLIDPPSSLHIGIRGTTYLPSAIDLAREQGFEVISLDDMFEMGHDRLLAHIHERLAGLRFIAFDVNTVSPPHDVGGMTAMLAARVMYECVLLACRRPG